MRIYKYFNLLAVSLLILFGVFTGQIEFMAFLFMLSVAGFTILRFFLHARKGVVYTIFGLFLLIYGTLTLITQYELISRPYDDFFVHNDAAWSFYKWTMDEVVPLKWPELIKGTLLNPLFYEYALAELINGTVAKIAVALGIEDVRLALRCLSVLYGALITAILADILVKNKVDEKQVLKSIVLFGCCSYLFVTSAVFTRDVFVCFIYVAIAHVILVPHSSFRFIKLLFLSVCAFGARPENGAFAIIFVMFYYLSLDGSKLRNYFLLALVAGVVVIFLLYTTFIADSLDTIQNFGEDATESTGGVFERVYSLPFPINKIAMVVYMLLQPLPMEKYIVGEGNSWFTLPFILSPYLIAYVVICCLGFVFHRRFKNLLVSNFILVSLLGFCLITFVSPDIRRSFATIPGLFGAYCLVYKDVPHPYKKFTKLFLWPMIFIINIFFQVYVMTK